MLQHPSCVKYRLGRVTLFDHTHAHYEMRHEQMLNGIYEDEEQERPPHGDEL